MILTMTFDYDYKFCDDDEQKPSQTPYIMVGRDSCVLWLIAAG